MVTQKEEIENKRIFYEWMDMNSESELLERVKGITEKRGRAAIEKARKEILDSQYDGGVVSSALKYFARVALRGGLPVLPTLVSISCEAVGGKKGITTSMGAALTLIAGAADIHDDIIDQSSVKYSKKTVFGKFGGNIALLAGDALLIQGSTFLQKECESLSQEQRNVILSFIPEALFEISKAEAKELHLIKKLNTPPLEYFEAIKLKAVVPEVHCKIGAILGDGKADSVQFLGNYGRAFGIASIIRDEFIDLLEYTELVNRIENECLPLPVLHAFQNPEIGSEVRKLLKRKNLTKKAAKKIAELVLVSKQVRKLKRDLESTVKYGLDCVNFVQDKSLKKELASLLLATNVEL